MLYKKRETFESYGYPAFLKRFPPCIQNPSAEYKLTKVLLGRETINSLYILSDALHNCFAYV